MERVLTLEEKIKRAEEIYQRRKSNNNYLDRTISTRVNVNETRNYGLLKKMGIQILVCMLIYTIFYISKNSEYIFSEQILTKTNEILSYDTDFKSLYEQFFNNIVANNLENSEIQNEQQNLNTIEQNNTLVINQNENAVVNTEETKVEETLSVTDEVNYTEEVSSFNQMEVDAKEIRENYSIIKPLNGTITSRFGIRNPTTDTVPKYHTGIDIARADGSKIIAAMDGTVALVSSYGDYGNHVKIMNNDVMTLYAHCQKIYVSEGEEIKQGQEIGEVGRTGNVTGAHLHFEIRKSDRYVDPDMVLQF